MKSLVLILILTFSFYTSVFAEAEVYSETETGTEQTTMLIDFDGLDFDAVESYSQKYDFSFSQTVKNIVTGNFKLSLDAVKNKAFDIFLREVKSSVDYIKSILIVCVLTGILKTAAGELRGKEVQKTVFFVNCIFVLSCIIISYNQCLNVVKAVVTEITDIIGASIPIIITVASAGGNIDVFSPVLLAVTDISASIINDFFIPLLMAAFSIKIINSMSDDGMLDKLSELLCFVITKGIKALSVAFTFWVSFERISSAATGDLVSKTTTAAVKMVPVVGGVLSGSTEIITTGIAAVKNGLGLAAVIFIIICCAVPVIKILVIALLYKAAAAAAEPVGDKCIVEMLDSFGKIAWIMLSMLFCIVFMYITAMIVLLCSVG